MEITLEFPGFLSAGNLKSGETLSLSAPMTVLDLLHHIGIRPAHIHHIQPFLNQAPARLEQTLSDGDHLFLYIPVGGG